MISFGEHNIIKYGDMMNTYFNEITSKPINKTDTGILYKIPAGAMSGNGDLAVVFDNDEKDLVIHLSKCDFWKFTSGAHNDGGIKTIGNLIITNIDLENYNIKQYFDKGLLSCNFGNTEIELFVAPGNRIYFEIKAPDNASHEVSINLPDTCNSQNSETEIDGVKCYSRKFCGEEVCRGVQGNCSYGLHEKALLKCFPRRNYYTLLCFGCYEFRFRRICEKGHRNNFLCQLRRR